MEAREKILQSIRNLSEEGTKGYAGLKQILKNRPKNLGDISTAALELVEETVIGAETDTLDGLELRLRRLEHLKNELKKIDLGKEEQTIVYDTIESVESAIKKHRDHKKKKLNKISKAVSDLGIDVGDVLTNATNGDQGMALAISAGRKIKQLMDTRKDRINATQGALKRDTESLYEATLKRDIKKAKQPKQNKTKLKQAPTYTDTDDCCDMDEVVEKLKPLDDIKIDIKKLVKLAEKEDLRKKDQAMDDAESRLEEKSKTKSVMENAFGLTKPKADQNDNWGLLGKVGDSLLGGVGGILGTLGAGALGLAVGGKKILGKLGGQALGKVAGFFKKGVPKGIDPKIIELDRSMWKTVGEGAEQTAMQGVEKTAVRGAEQTAMQGVEKTAIQGAEQTALKGGAKSVSKLAAIPLLGPLIAGAFDYSDRRDRGQGILKSLAGGTFTAGGSLAGELGATLLGIETGPGAFVAGAAGGLAGAEVGSRTFDSLMGDSETPSEQTANFNKKLTPELPEIKNLLDVPQTPKTNAPLKLQKKLEETKSASLVPLSTLSNDVDLKILLGADSKGLGLLFPIKALKGISLGSNSESSDETKKENEPNSKQSQSQEKNQNRPKTSAEKRKQKQKEFNQKYGPKNNDTETKQSGAKPVEKFTGNGKKDISGIQNKELTPMQQGLVDALAKEGITDPRAVANVMAQAEAESGWKPRDEESSQYASSKSQYKGRGLIQLTGEDNYKTMTQELQKRGVDVDLVKNPELANDPKLAQQIAAIYYKNRVPENQLTDIQAVNKATGYNAKTNSGMRAGSGGENDMKRAASADKYYSMLKNNQGVIDPSDIQGAQIQQAKSSGMPGMLGQPGGPQLINVKGAGMVDVNDPSTWQGQAFAGGNTHSGTMSFAAAIQEKLGDNIDRFTGFDDQFHQGRKSAHNQGTAMDFTLKDASKSAETKLQMEQMLKDAGVKGKIIDEYQNPSGHATGGHMHMNFESPEDAELFRKFRAAQQSAQDKQQGIVQPDQMQQQPLMQKASLNPDLNGINVPKSYSTIMEKSADVTNKPPVINVANNSVNQMGGGGSSGTPEPPPQPAISSSSRPPSFMSAVRA